MSDHESHIVGWGLAGATLAWQYYFQRKTVIVYDSLQNHSSRVAAGLVNPIVFKRLTKSWMADELLPFAKRFYEMVESELGTKLISNRSIARVFASVEEQNNWASLTGDERFGDYLEPVSDLNNEFVNDPYGYGQVKTIGNLDVNTFLNLSKTYLSERGVRFINESFDFELSSEGKMVFCEGYQIIENPHFKYIPMKPTHGDVLTIRSTDLNIEQILNKNMFIMPLGDCLYRVGATYNWDKLEAEPTQEGKAELIEKLASFTSFSYEVVDHQAGIRPTISDRRPVLGTHPVHKNFHLFNGLGTKGVMIAPLFSKMMFDYLERDQPIDPAVDIKRFQKHFNA